MRYYAFISYKREDEKWANWLQNKLMHYKLPLALRKQNPSLPKRVHPVFRDTTDLSGGVLKKAITEALDSSRYLIVICSPRAAQSPWVYKEIQHFISTGREEYIIPFIVEGEPNAKDSTLECFPENLRSLSGSRELLGININEMGRDAAAIKVVSRLLGLQFDTLWQRWERERKKKMLITIIGVVLFALLCLAVGVYIAQKNVELDKANEDLIVANKNIIAERDKANKARKRAEMVSDSLWNAYDSINYQNNIISRQNVQLAQERDNVIRANWNMMINQARSVAQKAVKLVDQGNSYLARKILLEVLPDKNDVTPRPYVAECESALRYAHSQNTNVFKGHTNDVNSAVFSPDGKYIASASYDNTIRLWNVRNGECIRVFNGHTKNVNTVAFSPDGKYLVSASEDGTVRLWNVEIEECIKIYNHINGANTAVFSPDGNYVLSASKDGMVILRNVNSEESIRIFKGFTKSVTLKPTVALLLALYQLMRKSVTQAVYSHDGKYIVGSSIHKTIIWHVETGDSIGAVYGHITNMFSTRFSSHGKYIVTAANDGIVRLWNVETGDTIKNYKGHINSVNSAVFNTDGKYILSSSDDNTIRLWDTETGNCIRTFEGHTDDVKSAVFSPKENYIVSVSKDHTIRLWNVKTGDCVKMFNGHIGSINSVIFSPDGKYIVSASDDNTIRLWNIDSEDCIKTCEKFKENTSYCEYSPKKKYKVLKGNLRESLFYKICDAEKGDTIRNLSSLEITNDLCPEIFSPNEKYIALAFGNVVKLLNLEVRDYQKNLKGHTDIVQSAVFSPNGSYLVSGSDDKTVKIWDVESGVCVKTLNFQEKVETVRFSQDGRNIIFDLKAEVVKFGIDVESYSHSWEFKPLQELIDENRERFKDNPLTDEERREYYLE